MNAPAQAIPHGRVPPHDLHAEEALLGSIFDNAEYLDDVIGKVSAEDFYRERHRQVFEAMCSLAERREPIDAVMVADELRRRDPESKLEAPGVFLTFSGETTTNPAFYARIVREKALLRRTIEAAGSIAQLGYEQHGSVPDFLDLAQRRILAATDLASPGSEPEEGRAIVARSFKRIEKDYGRETGITGIESGIVDLDRITCGFQPADLIVLASRPSVGKTTCGLNWVGHAALRLGVPSFVLSMEMPKENLTDRLLAAESRVDGNRIRTGQLIESDWAKLAQAAGKIADASLYIDDEQNLTATAIAAKTRRVARKLAAKGKRLGLIMVDYLTLMKTSSTNDSVSARVGEDVKSLKALAKEMQVPLILLAQLNRELEKGGKRRRPVMSDLRDSGVIEQAADLLVFIHQEDDRHVLIVAKQRNGDVGDIGVSFTKHLCRFDNLGGGPRHFTETGEAA